MKKKTVILFPFYILSIIVSYGQIQWDSFKKIVWIDFKGYPPNNTSEFRANTFSSVECEYGSFDTCLFYNVRTLFHQEGSWYIDSTQELLEHERGHFNISEMYARKIRKYLRINLRKGTPNDEVKKSIDSLQEQKNMYQDLYDKETNYSKNSLKQREWSLKIECQLNKLKEYSICEFNNCSLIDE